MQNLSLKQVALAALVVTVIAFVVWHALGAFTHGVLGVRHMGMMGPGHMASSMMGQGQMGQGQMGHGQMGGSMAHGKFGMGPMGTVLTGDADRDFAQEMIPHHQLAVNMANDLLKSGKDPELKKLANEIIAAQQKEIEFLKGWIAKQPK